MRNSLLVAELPEGIWRLTFPLPLGVRHVHCYLLPGSDGWTLVDTGLGLPDHAGGGEDAQAATGAQVLQGESDYEQCERVWGSADWSEQLVDFLCAHGLPEPVAAELRHEERTFGPFIRFARDPHPLREGD